MAVYISKAMVNWEVDSDGNKKEMGEKAGLDECVCVCVWTRLNLIQSVRRWTRLQHID